MKRFLKPHEFQVLEWARLACLLICFQLRLATAADENQSTNVTRAAQTDIAPEIAQTPKWVIPLKFERLSKTAVIDPGQEQQWLLVNRQLNAQGNETFVHCARQVLTSAGVQNGSILSILFDPEYQKIRLHWLAVWRGTNRIDRLHQETMRVIQPERDLEDSFIFSGERSAVFLLQDIRVGDIVDYAYSIKDTTSVYGGRYLGSVRAQLSEPVLRLNTRLLVPATRRLVQKNHGTIQKPLIQKKGNFLEFTWDFKNVAGITIEDNVPGWYEPLPWVQLSEFQSWADVNKWMLSFFQNKAPFSPELTAQINQWRRIASKGEQVRTVLDFVQQQIRYLGIESGTNAYCPASPSTVYARRFGDCKDKTLFFVSVLRALGIESYPALVNTRLRRGVKEWHPDPRAFDHAIVMVRLDYRNVWLDPTATYQRGDLASRYLPAYHWSLVISPATRDLTIMPEASPAPKTTVSAEYRIGGVKEPCSIKIVTVAESRDAESFREEWATNTREAIEKRYANRHAELYSGLKLARPIDFSDDAEHNRIEMTEYYTVEQIWSRPSEHESYRCRFSPHNIEAELFAPSFVSRNMPLRCSHPQHQVYRAEIFLPGRCFWDLGTETIDDSAFEFERKSEIKEKSLILQYEYRSLEDFVPSDRAFQYVAKVKKARENLVYVIIPR